MVIEEEDEACGYAEEMGVAFFDFCVPLDDLSQLALQSHSSFVPFS